LVDEVRLLEESSGDCVYIGAKHVGVLLANHFENVWIAGEFV
jgi:hypothetical protein